MSIAGIGVDLVDIARLERTLRRWGDRITSRLFTEGEKEFCSGRARPGECFAAILAAKEAFFKALGTGKARGITWTDVEVQRQKDSPPVLRLSGKAGELFLAKEMGRIWLSLSHQGAFSVAMVVIERPLTDERL